MERAAWDPGQYLRFADERLRPAADLLARVDLESPARIIDLGCGPGNVTSLLAARFPRAGVIGIDASAPMLEKARAAAPGCRFVEADIAAWTPDAPPHLIYSNAALHWIGGHEALLPRLLSVLALGGVLAVQMPAMHDAPFRALQPEVAAAGPWAGHLRGIGSARALLAPEQYWDILRPRAAALDLWQTIYTHALQGEDAVAEWASGSSLRPFLDRLPDDDLRGRFRAAYAAALRPHYPRRPDGTTLLPFRRLFIIARRGAV